MKPEELQTQTDEELVATALQNQQALLVLIRRYEPRLLAYIRRISGVSVEDAEDILQDSFVDAYRHLAEFDKSLKFSSWIYRIVHNRTVSAYRKRKKALGDMSLDDADVAFGRLLSSDLDTMRQTEKSLTAEKVRKILDGLPERDRAVLVLAYLEDKSYEEIGDILRSPQGTVATWIHRAKKKFLEQTRNQPMI